MTNQKIIDTAWDFHDSGDFDKAFALCLPVAKEGFAPAQNLMGVLYANGRGVEKDINAAIEWYKKAAASDYRAALFNLGRIYDMGQDVPRDLEQAHHWHLKAAKAGNSKSMARVAEMFGKGEGTAENQEQAISWLVKAAQNGYKPADMQLDMMFINKAAEQYAYLMFPYMEQKAAGGDINAQGFVAAAYHHGMPNIERDLDKAVYWYEKLAQQGDEFSQDVLNRIKKTGR